MKNREQMKGAFEKKRENFVNQCHNINECHLKLQSNTFSTKF